MKINDSAISLAVVHEQEVVRGVLTDGDLRRAIIGGAELASSIEPYYSRDFVSVSPETSRADVSGADAGPFYRASPYYR